jgi:hypothetical protein
MSDPQPPSSSPPRVGGPPAADVAPAAPAAPAEFAAWGLRRSQPGFLGLPAAASIITLLSASCLLAGVWSLLAPAMTGESIGTRCTVVGVLACYLGALSLVVAVLCRWQAANPDALGASLVGCLCVVGMGVSLDLLKVDAPLLTPLLGCATAGLAVAAWRFWNRCSGGRTPAACVAPLLLLLAIHCAWPTLMGQALLLGHGGPEDARRWTSPMACWALGWGLSLAAAVLSAAGCLAPGLERPPAPGGAESAPPARPPFLASGRMRALLTLVLLTGTLAQAWVVGYSANLDILWSDLVPLLAPLLIAVGALLGPRRAAFWDGAALAVPAGAQLLLHVLPHSPGELNRGPEGVQQLLDALLAPAPQLALCSVAGVLLGLRLKRRGYLIGAASCAVAMILLWHQRDISSWQPVPALTVALGLLLAHSLWTRDWRRALQAAMLLEPVLLLALRADLAGPAWCSSLIFGLPCLSVVLAGLVWRTLVSDPELLVALWFTLIAIAMGGDDPRLRIHLALAIGWSALPLLAWYRRRRWALLLPLAVPGAGGLIALDLLNAGWLGVVLAFLLLAVAAVASRHRLRLQAAWTAPAGLAGAAAADLAPPPAAGPPTSSPPPPAPGA